MSGKYKRIPRINPPHRQRHRRRRRRKDAEASYAKKLGRELTSRLILALLIGVPFDESGARVDFKSYARHCSEPWSAVLDGTASKADEMRVHLRRGSYYNYAFADERKWLCLIATSPELEHPIHLYARRNNSDLLIFLQNPPKQAQRYTIALENTGEGHLKQQWQLTRVLATGWVAPSGF